MASPAPPTSELGALQATTPWSVPILDERETNRDLTWPRAVQTYAAMFNDSHIEGLYRGATLPIRAYHWYLDPNGAPPATVERISADYGLPIGETGEMHQRRTQRRFRFDRHLEDALRAIGYGHYYFEQVGEIGPDGLWHPRKLAPRPPRIIRDIRVARDGGLDYIKVPAMSTGPGLAQFGGVELPVSRLVAYIWDQEAGNWRGRSMFRSLYRPWKLKDRVLRVGAINIERAGGVPYIEAPKDAGPDEMSKLHALAVNFRVGESAGAALPYGAQLKFAQAAGGDAAINYVRLMNEEMARAWLMMFLQAGQTSSGHGSTQQVEQQIDYFAEIQKTIAGWFCDVFNEHMLEDDVEWNDGPDVQYAPLLRFKASGDPLAPLADALDQAQQQGALPVDSPTAAAVHASARPRARRAQAPASAAEQTPVEQAGTDMPGLQAAYQDAHDQLIAAWETLQADVITELVDAVAAAATVTEVAQITAAAVTASALVDIVQQLAAHGAQTAVDDAAHQGVTITAPDLSSLNSQVSDAAQATAHLLTMNLAQSAASRAVGLWGSGATPAEIADQVREHLNELAGQTASYELAGLATQAQNQGRFETWEQDSHAGRFYASAVNDTNTCEPCRLEDGDEFPTLSEARRDFPAGQFLGCQGMKRCRCAVVKVYAETPGQA